MDAGCHAGRRGVGAVDDEVRQAERAEHDHAGDEEGQDGLAQRLGQTRRQAARATRWRSRRTGWHAVAGRRRSSPTRGFAVRSLPHGHGSVTSPTTQGPRRVLGQVHRLVVERLMVGHDVASPATVLGGSVDEIGRDCLAFHAVGLVHRLPDQPDPVVGAAFFNTSSEKAFGSAACTASA